MAEPMVQRGTWPRELAYAKSITWDRLQEGILSSTLTHLGPYGSLILRANISEIRQNIKRKNIQSTLFSHLRRVGRIYLIRPPSRFDDLPSEDFNEWLCGFNRNCFVMVCRDDIDFPHYVIDGRKIKENSILVSDPPKEPLNAIYDLLSST